MNPQARLPVNCTCKCNKTQCPF